MTWTPDRNIQQEVLHCWASWPGNIKTRHRADRKEHMRRTSLRKLGMSLLTPPAGQTSLNPSWEWGVPWELREFHIVPHTGRSGGLALGSCMTQLSHLIDLAVWLGLFTQVGRPRCALSFHQICMGSVLIIHSQNWGKINVHLLSRGVMWLYQLRFIKEFKVLYKYWMALFFHWAFMDKINDRGTLSAFERLSQPILLCLHHL